MCEQDKKTIDILIKHDIAELKAELRVQGRYIEQLEWQLEECRERVEKGLKALRG